MKNINRDSFVYERPFLALETGEEFMIKEQIGKAHSPSIFVKTDKLGYEFYPKDGFLNRFQAHGLMSCLSARPFEIEVEEVSPDASVKVFDVQLAPVKARLGIYRGFCNQEGLQTFTLRDIEANVLLAEVLSIEACAVADIMNTPAGMGGDKKCSVAEMLADTYPQGYELFWAKVINDGKNEKIFLDAE